MQLRVLVRARGHGVPVVIESEIVVTVPGNPAPKGSLKCIGGRGGKGHVLIEDNKRTKPWREKLAWCVKRATRTADAGQPVGVEITSTIERPKAHYGTGRNADTLKGTAPAYPVGHNTGDVDKLARLVLDALQDAKVLPDDCQVIEVVSRKGYPQPDLIGRVPDALPYPGVLLRIYPLP